MKSFVSNDNTPSRARKQGGARVKVEPTCHSLIIHTELSWDAVDILDTLFVALGECKQAIQYRRLEVQEREERRAENDNCVQTRIAESIELGRRYAKGLQTLCDEGYTRPDALSEMAKRHNKPVKEIETFIKLANRKAREERDEQVRKYMDEGMSVREVAKALSVSSATAGRIMKSLRETGDD